MARFPASGLTVAAFCKAEGISTNSFFYWKRLLPSAPPPASDTTPRLLAVSVPPTPPLELVFPNGIVLRLSPDCDLAFLRSLLHALTEQPC